jgi:pimeloyl-ACP methyl ester carboxylesterase
LSAAAAINVPTLAIAHYEDPLHPFEFAAALARTIRGAKLERVTSKSVDAQHHAEEVQQTLTAFHISATGAELQRLGNRALMF